MNPSTKGWINKFGKLVSDQYVCQPDFKSLYNQLRKDGFIYGYNLSIPQIIKGSLKYSTDEIAKINLLNALFQTFLIHKPQSDYKDFLSLLFSFYTNLDLNPKLSKILSLNDDISILLEKIIEDRVLLGKNPIARSFNRTIANALLYVDVLTFKKFLFGSNNVKQLAVNIENIIINISMEVGRHIKESGDFKLGDKYLGRYKDSYFFSHTKKREINKNYRKTIIEDYNLLERLYFMDIGCAICYSDLNYSDQDIIFIDKLGRELDLDVNEVEIAKKSVINFYKENKEARKELRDSNPILNFYDHSYSLISKLIERNIKRILKEIYQSKDLLYLIVEARKRPLTIEEQKKIQQQLSDILKSIPSLAIFMLPGGAILLPIFAKILPDLMPSSFDENKI